MNVTLTVSPTGIDKDLLSSMSRLNNRTQIRKSLFINNVSLDKRFQDLKEKMIKEFNNHPITQEILAGPSGSNSSGTLGGYGNLFSFIGFTKGEKPIKPIIDLLMQTTMDITKMDRRGRMRINITLPSKEDIFSVTPLPYAPGISWAKRMESGLSGLGYFLSKKNVGRSTGGVQVEEKLGQGRFQNVRYISDFINRWQKQFSNIAK